MEWIDWVLTGDKLLGVILGLIALLAGVARWFWKRVSSHVSVGVSGLQKGHEAILGRLDAVEADITVVRQDQQNLGKRVFGVERSLETVARQADVAALTAELRGVVGELKQLSGMTHSLRESAYRVAEGKK